MSRKAAVEPKWNFYLDTNKSTGIKYVQTSYNIWVPEKKQPRLGGKAYAGRLFPDGSVRPSKTFLDVNGQVSCPLSGQILTPTVMPLRF